MRIEFLIYVSETVNPRPYKVVELPFFPAVGALYYDNNRRFEVIRNMFDDYRYLVLLRDLSQRSMTESMPEADFDAPVDGE